MIYLVKICLPYVTVLSDRPHFVVVMVVISQMSLHNRIELMMVSSISSPIVTDVTVLSELTLRGSRTKPDGSAA